MAWAFATAIHLIMSLPKRSNNHIQSKTIIAIRCTCGLHVDVCLVGCLACMSRFSFVPGIADMIPGGKGDERTEVHDSGKPSQMKCLHWTRSWACSTPPAATSDPRSMLLRTSLLDMSLLSFYNCGAGVVRTNA